VGRLLSTTEAVVGQVYLVTFVAMIVGLLAQTHNRTHPIEFAVPAAAGPLKPPKGEVCGDPVSESPEIRRSKSPDEDSRRDTDECGGGGSGLSDARP